MLEKFISIQNVGRFRDYRAAGDVSLGKLTLIYAENGRGKTTLCSILRSLQSGEPAFIAERKTLATSDPASINIRFTGNNVRFSNGTWTLTHPHFAIFDSVFVHDNVYSGDYVEHEHNKNLYRVIVGSQGVQLARQVDLLDAQIREANSNIRQQREAVNRYVPRGITLEDFLGMSLVEDAERKIKQKSDEIAIQQRAFEKASEIKSRGLMGIIQMPSLPNDFQEILAKQIADVSIDAENRVREHVARRMDSQGESWLAHGLKYIKNNECPFCSQSIEANDLITAYRSYFNAEYERLKADVSGLEKRVDSAIGDISLYSVQQMVSGNQTLAEFWRQFFEVSIPEVPFEKIQESFARLRKECTVLIQRKQANPVELVIPGKGFAAALAEIEQYLSAVESYNTAVASCNERIKAQKEVVSRDPDLSALQKELSTLETSKRRFEADVMEVCENYQNALNAKLQLERQKQEAKQQLDQYCADILQVYEQSINKFLDQFNVGFRIANIRHQYVGGTPSSDYQIVINNTPIECGDSRTPAGTPCFKTALSSGDRSALALAFFLAVLKQDAQIGEKIIVLDDPFTSLDRFRRTCTQQLIHWLANVAQQVIVFSHDPHFLKLLWDGYSTTDIKTLQLAKAGGTTVIGEWDIEAETQSSYLRDFSMLLTFYRERRGDPRSVARAIRPFLEAMLRNHFPGHFQQHEWLGDFIEKIRNADSSSGLQHAKDDLQEYVAINDYSKKYHHATNINADSEPINDDELHGFVKRTLKLVGGD